MECMNEREQGLLRAREIYGEKTEQALREFLELYDERFYLWLSKLYMPRKCVCNNFDAEGNRVCLLPKDENGKHLCSGGGFYYCNSARDTEGYEIDIESTVQAIQFLRNAGLLRGFNDDYIQALPKQFRLDVCAFAKSLQSSEDGFFYHPQWGKNVIVQRRGRDLTWSTYILDVFGDMPLYDTPDGKHGSLGSPSEIKGQVGANEKASTLPEHLKTLDAFKEYLNKFDMKVQSYPAGNALNAQRGQIVARDKQAIIDGEAHDNDGDGIAEDGYVAALKKFVDDTQNPENGLWSDKVTYNGVNGLMKIVCTISGKLNYAEQSFKSAMEMTLLPVGVLDAEGRTTTYSIDVYNPWIAMSVIMKNIKKYGTEEEYERIRALLKENAADLVKTSLEKAKKFKKEDGSFGYNWASPPSHSQGAPVCPPGIIEGDVNGGKIAITGIFGNMVATLGLNIPIYLPEDFEKFKENLNLK